MLILVTLCECEHLNSFQVYNARYEEYIDPPAGHVFSDKDKIRLVCNENLQMDCRLVAKLQVYIHVGKLMHH